MWQLMGWLQKNLTWSIPAAMLLGLAFGYGVRADFLKSLILPLTFLMVYPMMVTMNVKELFKAGGAKLQLTALLINFVLIPALGFVIGWLFFKEQPLARLGLLLTSLLTPLYLSGLLGAVVEVPLLQVFTQIAVIVFLPLVLGYLTQKWLVQRHGMQRYNQEIKPKFPPVSTLGVLGIVFVSMALKAPAIIDHPSILAMYLLPLLLIYAINFTLSTLIGKALFPRGDAIALVYGTVMRNLSIALAIALGVFGAKGAEAALLIALAYIVQVQAAAWYVKFSDRLFGKPLA